MELVYEKKYDNSLKIEQDKSKKEEEQLYLKKNKDFINNQPDDFKSFRIVNCMIQIILI